jgi:hypothetical protein
MGTKSKHNRRAFALPRRKNNAKQKPFNIDITWKMEYQINRVSIIMKIEKSVFYEQ